MAARRVGAVAEKEAGVTEATELHRRTIDFDVVRGADGRTSVRGELLDLRRIGMGRQLGSDRGPGTVHHMGLVAELDRAGVVSSVDARMDVAPFEPSGLTGGEGCRHILPNYQRLVGQRFDDQYAARVLEEIGGPQGCFHILSLAQCMPFAVLAARSERMKRSIDIRATASESGSGFRLAGALVDDDGAIAESRLALDLEFPGFRIARAVAEGPSAEKAPALEGLAIKRGFTAAALERLGGARDLVALVVAVSPLTAQASGTYAAFLGWDLRPRSRARAANPQIDSCHMWRTDGPLVTLAAVEASKGETG